MATQTQVLHLGPADEGRLISADEFAEATYVKPWKYEREGGRLIVLAPSGEDHSSVQEPLRDYLGAYRLAHREIVDLVASEAWVRVDGGTDRIGDIGVYLVQDGPRAKVPDRVPDLIFEVVSPGKVSIERDYVLKRSEYQRLGVKEYVIVDRFHRLVTVLSASPDGFTERTLGPDESYGSRWLPGLVIPLRDVF